jgi:hypothetical protein
MAMDIEEERKDELREESPTPNASTSSSMTDTNPSTNRPVWKSVLLVLICTLAMITNVRNNSMPDLLQC